MKASTGQAACTPNRERLPCVPMSMPGGQRVNEHKVEVDCPLCSLPRAVALQQLHEAEATADEPGEAAEKATVDAWLVVNCPWDHGADDLARWLDQL